METKNIRVPKDMWAAVIAVEKAVDAINAIETVPLHTQTKLFQQDIKELIGIANKYRLLCMDYSPD